MTASRSFGRMAALLAGPLMVAGAAGVAGSEPPPPPAVAAATGANWMVVTVTPLGGDAPEWCRVDPYFGTPETLSLAVAPTGNVFVDAVPAGTHTVAAWCPNGGSTTTTVTVTG
ncbi:hypothetical protein [Nocardia farcinica]|uniref:hypothetical protein n=1 Tax=Nocardia farcinica TaxID=37329 RepID=UPI00189598AA|nr:hypothetical protein [Nocardia farcinica]MBF6523105.1 hypothetical protein [Nocardia farcinica]